MHVPDELLWLLTQGMLFAQCILSQKKKKFNVWQSLVSSHGSFHALGYPCKRWESRHAIQCLAPQWERQTTKRSTALPGTPGWSLAGSSCAMPTSQILILPCLTSRVLPSPRPRRPSCVLKSPYGRASFPTHCSGS